MGVDVIGTPLVLIVVKSTATARRPNHLQGHLGIVDLAVRNQDQSLATLALELHALRPELGDELSALTARLMLRVCGNLGHVEIHNELAYALLKYENENDY